MLSLLCFLLFPQKKLKLSPRPPQKKNPPPTPLRNQEAPAEEAVPAVPAEPEEKEQDAVRLKGDRLKEPVPRAMVWAEGLE